MSEAKRPKHKWQKGQDEAKENWEKARPLILQFQTWDKLHKRFGSFPFASSHPSGIFGTAAQDLFDTHGSKFWISKPWDDLMLGEDGLQIIRTPDQERSQDSIQDWLTVQQSKSQFCVKIHSLYRPLDQFLHVGLAMSVVSLHDKNQVSSCFEGPSKFHLTKFAFCDTLCEKDQNIAWVRHTGAHALHRGILAGLKQNTISLFTTRMITALRAPCCTPACSISNQKEAPRKRSDNARRRFCTASWAFDCLWPQQIAQDNAQAMHGTSTISKDSEQNLILQTWRLERNPTGTFRKAHLPAQLALQLPPLEAKSRSETLVWNSRTRVCFPYLCSFFSTPSYNASSQALEWSLFYGACLHFMTCFDCQRPLPIPLQKLRAFLPFPARPWRGCGKIAKESWTWKQWPSE